MWKVRDIMKSAVVTVNPDMPVRELVQVLAKSRISGAPVMTAAGALAGVVSATDVLALAAYGAVAHMPDPWANEEGAADEESAWYFRFTDQPLDLDVAGSEGRLAAYLVEDIMTPAAFSVEPDDTVVDLARFLLRGRIHRALVVENEKLVGIVTTYDVLSAVAAGMET